MIDNLYVVGNSHAHFFTFTHPGQFGWSNHTLISSHHRLRLTSCSLGPTTAFKFSTKYLPHLLSALEEKSKSRSHFVLIPVGEVDCRLHLPRQAFLQNRAIDDIVQECVHRFIRTLIVLRNIGYHPIAWGGHPSSNNPGDDDVYPRYGDTDYRNHVSVLWNQLLSLECGKHNIPHASILFDLLKMESMNANSIFQDGCHLKYSRKILDLALASLRNSIDLSLRQ